MWYVDQVDSSEQESLKARLREFQGKAPVDVVHVAESLGLKVWENDLSEDISGMIKHDTKFGGVAHYSIIVNKNEASSRKRFTVAHELAHYILHRTFIGDGVSDNCLYRSKLSTLQEVQANRLAADIIMPLELVEKEIKRGATSITELAIRFQVSEQAMRIRLNIPA